MAESSENNLPDTTNSNLEAPSQLTQITCSFWQTEITNNNLLNIYNRKGITTKTINQQVGLMFKNGWSASGDDTAKNISNSFNFDAIAEWAYLNSLISNFSTIYVEYGDTPKGTEGKDTPAPENKPAIGYYVITRAWIEEDIYHDQEVRDYYTVYRGDGQTFKIHKSRMIRVCRKNGLGMIFPAYDSIQVLDNVIWGTGQSMFRSGSGFPVLEVENGSKPVVGTDGQTRTRIQNYAATGLISGMNTTMGYIIDARDKLTFLGANGKALAPKEYFDVAIQMVSIDLDVPVDILKGVSAGAITGSEQNAKQYYGELSSKQNSDLEPIYNALFFTQNYTVKIIYVWNSIFEMSPSEVSLSLKEDNLSIHNMEKFRYMTHGQCVRFFNNKYPTLGYTEKDIKALENQETFVEQTRTFNIDAVGNDDSSALPKTVQRSESKFMKETTSWYKDTSDKVVNLLQGFNTD